MTRYLVVYRLLNTMSGKAQSWRKSVLTLKLYLIIVKSIVKFLMTNTVLKEAGKVVLPIFVNQFRIIYYI